MSAGDIADVYTTGYRDALAVAARYCRLIARDGGHGPAGDVPGALRSIARELDTWRAPSVDVGDDPALTDGGWRA